jgi:Predicted pyridoxal phosphate-dependent enzyme apparently involved in regulation of cell wall biogenesis
MNKIFTKSELEVMESGVWGTIGPYSVSGARALAEFVGARYGLLCHSASSAYESVLRACGASHGRCIITPSYGDPNNTLTAACTGTAPLFCDVDAKTRLIDPVSLEKAIERPEAERAVAVVADFIPGISGFELEKISALCKTHLLPLILNAGGWLSARYNGKPLTDFADAVVWSLSSGSEVCIGNGGFTAFNHSELYADTFAYHNCGRSPGDGCTLTFDDILGGDMRITEWAARLIELLLEEGNTAMVQPKKFTAMHREPALHSDYFIKQTGLNWCSSDEELQNSIFLSN